MEDARIWEFEQSLWTGDADDYREKVHPECVMALPAPPFIFDGSAAIEAVSDTPRWSKADFANGRISRPKYGLITIAYNVRAERDGQDSYEAHCTSTLLLDEEADRWHVVQHAQVPKLAMS